MASLNKVFIVGNLCADVETRQAGSTTVAHMRMAINESFKSKSGDKVEKVVYVDVEAWDKLAENCSKFLGKGSAALVDGRLQMDEWEDKQSGQKRNKLKVRADNVQFLTFKDKKDEQPTQPAHSSVLDQDGDSIPF